MADIVVFPDTNTLARKIALQGLAEHGVTGIKVATQKPSPMPARVIQLFTMYGGEISRRTQWCQVVGFVYDTDDVRANQTAQLLGAVLRAAPDTVIDGEQLISEPCEKHGPFPSQDPDLPNVPRYQVNLTWTVQSLVNV